MKWWHVSVIVGLIVGFSAVALNRHLASSRVQVAETSADVDAKLSKLKPPVVVVGAQEVIGGSDVKVVDGDGVFYSFSDSALRGVKPGYRLK